MTSHPLGPTLAHLAHQEQLSAEVLASACHDCPKARWYIRAGKSQDDRKDKELECYCQAFHGVMYGGQARGSIVKCDAKQLAVMDIQQER